MNLAHPIRSAGAAARSLLAGFALAAVLGSSASAQVYNTSRIPQAGEAQRGDIKPRALNNVGVDQRLGETVDLALPFRDETGRAVKLGDYFHQGKPVLLALVYYECPMLCNQVLNGMTSALSVLKFDVGREFEVVTVSFDPREGHPLASEKKKTYLDRYRRAGADRGWHFLTGDQPAIDAITRAAGFRYAWDDTTKQWAHGSAIMVLTPDGKLSQYFYGIEYSPKDLRLALVESSQGKVGNIVDTLTLYCYHYDPASGRYGAIAMNIMRLGGVVTMFSLGLFLAVMIRRDRKQGRAAAPGENGTTRG